VKLLNEYERQMSVSLVKRWEKSLNSCCQGISHIDKVLHNTGAILEFVITLATWEPIICVGLTNDNLRVCGQNGLAPFQPFKYVYVM
jgi:hypothetical protein